MEQQILTIDTAAGTSVKTTKELLPIYSDKHPLMRMVIPNYQGSFPDFALEDIIDRLMMTRQKYKGIGLAANQCGVPLRAFVIGTETFDMVCINPEVLEVATVPVNGKEGCLSFPGLFLKVKRSEYIKVRYTNIKGEVVEEYLTGLTARCFQHELDHLNGKVITDYAGRMKMHMAKKKREKLIKSIERREMYRG